MNLSLKIKAALVVASSVFCAIATAQQPDRLSVPVIRLEMTMPAGRLVQQPVNIGGSTSSPRYLSVTAKESGAQNRAAIESILKSIAVKEKPGG